MRKRGTVIDSLGILDNLFGNKIQRIDMNSLLQQLLSEQIEGEVRFDLYSKALYSTDASLYQIEPIGVVIPLHKTDILRTIQFVMIKMYQFFLVVVGPVWRGKPLGKPLSSIHPSI